MPEPSDTRTDTRTEILGAARAGPRRIRVKPWRRRELFLAFALRAGLPLLAVGGLLSAGGATGPWPSPSGILWILLLALSAVLALVLPGRVLLELLRQRRLFATGAPAVARVKEAKQKSPVGTAGFYTVGYEFKDSQRQLVQGTVELGKGIYSGERALFVFFNPDNPRDHIVVPAAWFEPVAPPGAAGSRTSSTTQSSA